MADTAVVILNYNGASFLRQFLAGVVENTPDADIIVADNQSSDESVEYLKKYHPSVRLIELDQNYGFTGGYNRIIYQLDYKYTLLLNSDIEVTSGWLPPLVNFMEAHPEVAACQPKVLDQKNKEYFEYAGAAGGFIDTLGFPYCRGRIFDHLEQDQGQYDESIKIFWSTGAAMLIRTDLYQKSGGLDEDFFAHMEEIDLCWRLQRMGYGVYCIPDSTVYHVGGGTLNKSNPRKTYFNFRNNLSMVLKNESAYSLLWKLPLKLSLDWIAAIKFWKDISYHHFLAVLKAHCHFMIGIRSNLKKRRQFRKNTEKHSTLIKRPFIIFEYFIKKRKTFSDLIDWHSS